jgi:hypothetical protein
VAPRHVKRFEARAFKCGADENTHRGWCMNCDFSVEGESRLGASRVARACKRHTETTGHETRIDTESQRGFRASELQEDEEDDAET